MKIRDISFLAVRILSVYTFLLGISNLATLLNYAIPAYIPVIEDNTTYSELFFIVGLPAFALIICGVVLWFFAMKLSGYFVPKNARESEATVQLKDIEGFVLSVIGLILVVLSLGTIVRVSLNYIYIVNQDVHFQSRTLIYTLAEYGIRFIIGIILLVKAEGLALILRKIRGLGMKRLARKDEETDS